MSLAQLVEVRFKGNRKAYFEWHDPEPLRLSDPVIVESERGLDYGVVNAVGKVAQQKCDRCRGCGLNGEARREGKGESETRAREPEPTRKVVRRASVQDRKTAAELRQGEDDVRRKVREKVNAHNLPMKVSDAEWQWDRNKLTVFFTAEKRVDFRALVRELASQFRTRIELRQIGVRDEAARIGGIGRCGRELCSASWLPELLPIGLHIAKDQHLSLNPSQISGPCGRLLCCLRYEHEFYVQSRKRFPKEGKVLQTAKGFEKVYSIDIFRERVTLRAEDGSMRVMPLAELKAEVEASGASSGGTGAPGHRGTGPAMEVAVAVLPMPPSPSATVPVPPAEPSGEPTGERKRRRRRRRGKRRGQGGAPGQPGGEPQGGPDRDAPPSDAADAPDDGDDEGE